MLREGSALAEAVDLGLPRCVKTIDETVALIRESREAWLRAQASHGDAAAPAEGRNT